MCSEQIFNCRLIVCCQCCAFIASIIYLWSGLSKGNGQEELDQIRLHRSCSPSIHWHGSCEQCQRDRRAGTWGDGGCDWTCCPSGSCGLQTGKRCWSLQWEVTLTVISTLWFPTPRLPLRDPLGWPVSFVSYGINGRQLRFARSVGAAPQLTELWSCRLDHQNWVGIKRLVQTKKPPQIWSGSKSRSNPHHPAICTKPWCDGWIVLIDQLDVVSETVT